MWANITADRDSQDWLPSYKLAGIFTESMSDTFETPGDELPHSRIWGTREKYIHTVGTVAKAEWVSKGNHPYTGIFKGAT